MDIENTILLVLGGVIAVLIAFNVWRYNVARKHILSLLHKRGPMTSLDLIRSGVSRSYIYVALGVLENNGKIVSFTPHGFDPSHRRYVVRKIV